jgi:hypothetical protein
MVTGGFIVICWFIQHSCFGVFFFFFFFFISGNKWMNFFGWLIGKTCKEAVMSRFDVLLSRICLEG